MAILAIQSFGINKIQVRNNSSMAYHSNAPYLSDSFSMTQPSFHGGLSFVEDEFRKELSHAGLGEEMSNNVVNFIAKEYKKLADNGYTIAVDTLHKHGEPVQFIIKAALDKYPNVNLNASIAIDNGKVLGIEMERGGHKIGFNITNDSPLDGFNTMLGQIGKMVL